ncbi:MAG TPA: hypothetical protein VI864_02170 [Candidatus Bathyarchaeia archaeon]|nr:hypothetical protein [Candidatus Bathyarchaeia archaeon]
MNKLLQRQAQLLASTFNDFGTFDFNKELAEKMVSEHKAFQKFEPTRDFLTNENLGLLLKAGIEISPLIPFFESQKGKLILKSARFFEIIRFALAVSAFIKGADQFVSAEKLSAVEQHQFTVFAYYSSVFHLLTSFLAIHGIVYCPKSMEGVSLTSVRKKEDGDTVKETLKVSPTGFDKFVKGFFNSEKNEWNFSNISNDHATRWKEFCDLLKKYIGNNWEKEIPKGVIAFWGYMKVIAEYKETFWDKEKKEYIIAFTDKKELLKVLNSCQFLPAKIRHQKIYEDRHFDLFGESFTRKSQNPPDELAKAEESFFRRLAKDLLAWQYVNFSELFEFVKKNCAKEVYFARGMNAVADNPFVRTLDYLKASLAREERLSAVNKNLPEFINMLFA